jgi:AraC-like DNA-binding protein
MKVRLLGEVLTSLSTASKDAETNSDDEEYVQELISAVSRGLDSDCSTAGFRPRRQLADLERYVLLNIHEPELELGRLASAVSLSRRSLYRLFECEGLTPSNWLWSVRLNAARDRLSSEAWQDCSITDIAFAVGFNDSAHFSRAFRKRYGTSPRQFRTASKAEFA